MDDKIQGEGEDAAAADTASADAPHGNSLSEYLSVTDTYQYILLFSSSSLRSEGVSFSSNF